MMFWSILLVVVAAITLGVSWLGGVRQLVPISIGSSALSALLFVVAGVRERGRIRRARRASPGEAPRVRTVPASNAGTATPAKTRTGAAPPTKTRATGGAATRKPRRPVIAPSDEPAQTQSQAEAGASPGSDGVKVLRPSPAARRRPARRPPPAPPEPPPEGPGEPPSEPVPPSLAAGTGTEEPDTREPAPIDFDVRLPWEEEEQVRARSVDEEMMELRELLREDVLREGTRAEAGINDKLAPPRGAQASVDEPTQLLPLDEEMAPAGPGPSTQEEMRETPRPRTPTEGTGEGAGPEPEIVPEPERAAAPQLTFDALELELSEEPAAPEPAAPSTPEISEPAAAGAPAEEEEPGIVVVQQVGRDLRMRVARPSGSKPKASARKKTAASKAKSASAKSAAAKAKPKAKPAARAKPAAKAKPKPKPKPAGTAKAKPKPKPAGTAKAKAKPKPAGRAKAKAKSPATPRTGPRAKAQPAAAHPTPGGPALPPDAGGAGIRGGGRFRLTPTTTGLRQGRIGRRSGRSPAG
ncbi:MAG: hypothetical protein ACRDJ4_09055 [Actinomycetota bacterium]